MRIDIYNEKYDLLENFELETNPFKVGETIEIMRINHDKDKKYWEVDELVGKFKIFEITHSINTEFRAYTKPSFVFTVKVFVKQIKK